MNGFSLKESAITEEKVEKARLLNEIARERGESLAEMALAWVLDKKPVASVIIGASRAEQISENVKAANYTPFTKEQLKKIDEIAL